MFNRAVIDLARKTGFLIGTLLPSLIYANPAAATEDGSADPSWHSPYTYPFHLTDISVQNDGSVIASGYDYYSGTRVPFAVQRYDSSGHIDTTFGNNGTAATTVGDGNAYAWSVSTLSDGAIVTAGGAQHNNQQTFAVVKYHANGELDHSFGQDGVFTGIEANLLGYSGASFGKSIVELEDGKLLLLGYDSTSQSGTTRGTVIRLNPNGSLDTSFGSAGKSVFTVGGRDTIPTAIKVSAAGKIYVGGTTRSVVGNDKKMFVVRLQASGGMDTSFGSSGVAQPVVDGESEAWGLALQGGDETPMLVGKWVKDIDTEGTLLLRLDDRGTVDPTFGEGGFTFLDIAPSIDSGRAIEIDDRGRLIVAGTIQQAQGFATGAFIVRLNEDGELDSSFGSLGKVYPNGDSARATGIDSDGGLYLVSGDFSLEKFVNESPATLSASFTASAAQGDAPLTVDFTGLGQSSHSDDSLAYRWDFGDGSSSNLPSPSHEFADPGQYTVYLSVTNQSGQSAGYQQTIQVTDPAHNGLSASTLNCLFDWGEDSFPSSFAPRRQDTQWLAPFHYRHYAQTRTYIGVSTADEHLYFLSDGTGLIDLGMVTTWQDQANCGQTQ